MAYKKQVISLAVLLVFFVLANFFVWKKYTELLLTDKYAGGDLARMAYFLGSRDYRTTFVDLPLKHLEMDQFRGQHVDILTIGDSFSIGGGGGKNSYYQDYIASINNLSVMNVPPYPTDDLAALFAPLSTLKVLYTSGYLDIIKPRIILIESVERYSIERFAKPFDLGTPVKLEKVGEFYRNKWNFVFKQPNISFINEGNVKYIYYNLLYRLSLNPMKGKVRMERLDTPLFSVKENKKLLFHRDDIKNIKKSNIDSIKLLNENFNSMAMLLREKGIKLYFMPIVDKYDLYSKHIVNNQYPQSAFFELLRPLHKEYGFIDTKAILSEELNNGVKDIYYADDTHWSWKAARDVFEKVRFR